MNKMETNFVLLTHFMFIQFDRISIVIFISLPISHILWTYIFPIHCVNYLLIRIYENILAFLFLIITKQIFDLFKLMTNYSRQEISMMTHKFRELVFFATDAKDIANRVCIRFIPLFSNISSQIKSVCED